MAARATVIIPTFSEAPFIGWALASARAQTVHDLEICVICDGSPPHMVELIEHLAREDRRIRFFVFPKGERHGEAYRHQVILGETTGEIICYLSHDDLYLPWHVESLEHALKSADFTHSIAVSVSSGDCTERRIEIQHVALTDLDERSFREAMLDWPGHRWGFGLVYGAHTRNAYLRLPEGWTAAPADIPTDMSMWQKFLRDPSCRLKSQMEVTALHFDRSALRTNWSPQEREAELAWWFPRTQAPGFRQEITDQVMRWLALDAVGERRARIERSQAPVDDPLRLATAPQLLLDLWSVWRSGLFDRDWYLKQNPDVDAAGVNPLWHFLRWGGPEGRSPGPTFNSEWYRRTYLSARRDRNPLTYYVRRGKAEGHLPLPPLSDPGPSSTRTQQAGRVGGHK